MYSPEEKKDYIDKKKISGFLGNFSVFCRIQDASGKIAFLITKRIQPQEKPETTTKKKTKKKCCRKEGDHSYEKLRKAYVQGSDSCNSQLKLPRKKANWI